MTLSILLLATGCIDGPSGSADPGDQDTDMAAPQPDAGNMQDMGNPQEDMSDPPDMGTPPADMTEPTDDGLEEDQGAPSDMAADMPPSQDMGCESGSPAPDEPFVICEAMDFEQMRLNPENSYVLGKDVILPEDFQPIRDFSGDFDGQGHTISGISLTQTKANAANCGGDDAPIYIGGFISHVENATLNNIEFGQVLVGQDTVLKYTHQDMCRLNAGGLFGRISGSQVTNIKVNGLDAHTNALFGGIAYQADSSTFSSVHVIDAQGTAPNIISGNSAAGVILIAEDLELENVSFQGTIRATGAGPSNERSLFIQQADGANRWSNIAVRGQVVLSPNLLSSGRAAAGLLATLTETGSLAISDCAIEVSIDAHANNVAGLVANIREDKGNPGTQPFEVSDCYVGEFGSVRTSTLKNSKITGGLLGTVEIAGERIELTHVYVQTDLDASTVLAPPYPARGCISATAFMGEPTLREVHPMNAPAASPQRLLCESEIAATMNTALFSQTGRHLRLTSLESWFGPLRISNFSIEQ